MDDRDGYGGRFSGQLPMRAVLGFIGLFALLLFGSAQAQYVFQGNSHPLTMRMVSGHKAAGTFSPSCSQSSNFIARLTSPPLANETAYDAFICGGVTDGWWAKMDVVYMFATYNSTSALLNLVSASFNGTSHGTLTFTISTGFTGDGSTGYIDTAFVPSTAGGHATQTAFHSSICQLQAGSGGGTVVTGATDGTIFTETVSGGTSIQAYVNQAPSGPLSYIPGGAPSAALYLISRTSDSQIDMYKNGTNVATATTPATNGFIGRGIYVFARDNTGTADNWSNQQLSMFTFGGVLSATDATNLQSRANTYMSAFGISVC